MAIGMEVAVERASGKIAVERVACAHDCGQIINPDGVRAQVEGSILQTLSRVLMEEVKFDRARVVSVDWASYPIMRFSDVPKLDIELIDRPTRAAARRRRSGLHGGRRGARQCGVRRDRRAAAHRSVHAGAREGGDEQQGELSGFSCHHRAAANGSAHSAAPMTGSAA